MKKLIVGNWKENPRTEAQALALFRAVAGARRTRRVELVVCPPFVYLERIAEERGRARNIDLGAQDVFWKEKGPYTSEVGPRMLRSLGVRYVIVGHSERRKWLKETDAMVNKKVKLALADGLRAILCVGEPLAVRKRGIAAARRFVATQLAKDLKNIKRNLTKKRLVVAYEPVWAIGTGRNDRPEDAREMAEFIKGKGIARVLYGGSVSNKNIADYVQYKSIDGALVGGASLKAGEFKKIVAVVAKIKNQK